MMAFLLHFYIYVTLAKKSLLINHLSVHLQSTQTLYPISLPKLLGNSYDCSFLILLVE